MSQIKAQIEDTTSDYDKEKLQERLAKLSGGVAVIKVGAATEVELKEKKHRIEDALSTTRAAVEEGLVAGGGTTLLQAIPALDKLKLEGDEQVGVEIVRKALEAPARQIADNAGAHGEVVVEKVKGLKKGHGFDALKGEYGDMFAKGIVDAAKVTRSALQNAASIAAMVLTTETLITDAPEGEGRSRCRRWPRPRRRTRRHGLLVSNSRRPRELRLSGAFSCLEATAGRSAAKYSPTACNRVPRPRSSPDMHPRNGGHEREPAQAAGWIESWRAPSEYRPGDR